MKIVDEVFLIHTGKFSQSEEFKKILDEIREAIKEVTWFSQNRFIINPTIKGNGVVPIKFNFIKKLISNGWKDEMRMSIVTGIKPGPIDVIIETSFGKFAVEWETGNISSSHRALNKIGVGLIQKQIIGGILILPVRQLAQFLTDRIGNYEEIEPYFCLYQNLNIQEGVLGIISVVYDELSDKAHLITKGKDGNALKS